MFYLNKKTQRMMALSFLGFASGLPLVLIGSTLQAWFTQAGLNLLAIGALSLIGFPYIWKFFWAPLLDRYLPPFLGRRRGWIVVAQLLLSIGLWILAQMNPSVEAHGMALLALGIAFVSATQDVAVDAYRTDILLPDERGLGIAFFIFAYRVAMLVSGGLALIFADHLGWQKTYEVMAVLMFLSMIPTVLAPESPVEFPEPTDFFKMVKDSLKDLLNRDFIVWILLFILTYKLGDALIVALTTNFLLRELHFTLTDIGLAYKTVGLVATILGAFVGGIALGRVGLYKGLLAFGFLQAISNLMYVVLAIVGKNYFLMIATISSEYFFAGMSSAALFAFLTALCNQRFSATHYACLSAIASLGRVLVGPFAALFVQKMGWINYYWVSVALCFPPLLLLTLLKTRVEFNVPAVA